MTNATTQKPDAPVDLVGNIDFTNLSDHEKLQLTISILEKESSTRNAKEIEFLKRGTENNKFFKEKIAELGFNTHDLLCKHMKHEAIPGGQDVFKYGEVGTKFYIILKGIAGVIIPIKKEGTNEVIKMLEVAQLPAGASFGELALLGKQNKRAATIHCKEDGHFAVLSKEHYQKILGEAEKQKLAPLIDFLLDLDVFQGRGWSESAMQPVVKSFLRKILPRGTVLYKEGQPSDSLFLIKSGEVKFTKQILIKPREPTEEVIIDENSHVYSYEKLPLKRTVEVAILGPKHFFGDDEAYLKLPHQSTAIVNTLEAEIWIIQRKELIPILKTWDPSYRTFVQQAQAKRRWREMRIEDITYAANEKIDPDLFVGANHNKTTQYTEVEARIKAKVYSRRQTQEQIVFQRSQLQELTQPPTVPTTRPLTQQSKAQFAQTITSADNSHSVMFYHNDNNNFDHKWFLNSKWKIPSSEENKSRILYTANSTHRPVTEANNSQHDLLSATTYQAFAGSFRQLTNNETITLNETKDEPEMSKSLLLIENPNLANQVPKGWNLNSIDDDFKVHDEDEVEPEQEGETSNKSQNGAKQMGNRRPRISKVNQKQYFDDAQSMMDHAIAAKKKIQQKLQVESFAKNGGAMYDFEELSGKSKRFRMIQQQKDRSHASAGRSRPGNQEKPKTDEFNAPVNERNAHSVLRQRISTREDDRSHENGNWTTLMSFLPQRVKMNVEILKQQQPDYGQRQMSTGPNKTIQTQGVNNTSRLILAEGQRQITTAHDRAQSRERSRGDLSPYESHPESRKSTPVKKRILVVGSGVNDQNKIRILDTSPNDPRSYSVDVGYRLHDRIHARNEIERGRLFDYNIMQKYKKRPPMASNGHRRSPHDDEKDKEKLLRTYEKFKNLKLQSLHSKKR